MGHLQITIYGNQIIPRCHARHREQRIGMQVFSGANEMSDSGSTRFSFQYYADANYSTLHNLRVRLALQDMYID
jgi:hypothetical protein